MTGGGELMVGGGAQTTILSFNVVCKQTNNIFASTYHHYACEEGRIALLIKTFNVTEATYHKCLYIISIKAA